MLTKRAGPLGLGVRAFHITQLSLAGIPDYRYKPALCRDPALRLMAPGFAFNQQFAQQLALGARFFRYANPRRSVSPGPTRRRSSGRSRSRPCC